MAIRTWTSPISQFYLLSSERTASRTGPYLVQSWSRPAANGHRRRIFDRGAKKKEKLMNSRTLCA